MIAKIFFTNGKSEKIRVSEVEVDLFVSKVFEEGYETQKKVNGKTVEVIYSPYSIVKVELESKQ